MLSYTKLKNKPRILQSLTGMSLAEFEALVPSFEKAWQDYIYKHFIEASERKREYGGGRKAELQESRDKMLFILSLLSAIADPRSTGIFIWDRTPTGKPMGASVNSNIKSSFR